MKLSVCVQTDEVKKQIPVALFTGTLAERAAKAASCGADGLELMAVDPRRLNASEVRATLGRCGLEASAIGSGAIAFATGLTLLHADSTAASRATALLDDLIDFARAIGAPLVTIGSFRGRLAPAGEGAEARLGEILLRASDRAAGKGVRLALEASNRYESDFIQNAEEGIALIRRLGHPALGLLLDTFHMNIEEPSWTAALGSAAEAGLLWHVHVGDSNRLPPGRGHIDFPLVVRTLSNAGYTGYLSAELLPLPDADTAGSESLTKLRLLVEALT